MICFKVFTKKPYPANVAADHQFVNMMDTVQCVDRGVLPPTPKEILGKYLDMFVAKTQKKKRN